MALEQKYFIRRFQDEDGGGVHGAADVHHAVELRGVRSHEDHLAVQESILSTSISAQKTFGTNSDHFGRKKTFRTIFYPRISAQKISDYFLSSHFRQKKTFRAIVYQPPFRHKKNFGLFFILAFRKKKTFRAIFYPRISDTKFYPKTTGANPTTVSYNASAVKNYNATSSLVHFEKKKYFLLL
jgi:hypothetical protein